MAFKPPHLLFLNNTSSWLFVAIFTSFLFITTSLIWIGVGFFLAITITTLARKYAPFVNQLAPIPRDRAIVITGCSSGIGMDAAIYFAKAGFTVFASVRKEADQAKLEAAFRSAEEPKVGSLIPLLFDVSNTAAIQRAVQQVTAHLDANHLQLHALVNNAGYAEGGCLEFQPLQRIRAQFETNVIGQIACVQSFLPLLRRTVTASSSAASSSTSSSSIVLAPRIIWLSSGVGELTFPSSCVYSASKHAVEALSHGLDIELAHWNIHSILVQPGLVLTEFAKTVGLTREAAIAEGRSSVSDPTVVEHYERAMAATSARQRSSGMASTTEVVVDAFRAALLDTAPLKCYKAGNDVQVLMPLSKLLPPNGLMDLLMRPKWL